MSHLPFHPVTGVQAIGFTSRGPVWPVMGGAPDPVDPPNDPPTDPPNDPPAADKGFPEDTPIAEMTTEQQLAYFKFHDRKKADTLKKFGGITPEQAQQALAEAEQLRQSKMTADERAIEEAKTAAATSAAEKATSKWAPKVLRATAGRFIDGDQLESFLNVTDVNKFIKDGEFDEDAVVGHLTGLFGGQGKQPPRQWGQSGTQPPAPSAKEAGLAEARRRGFITDKE